MREEWKDFVGGLWEKEINVRDFIQRNYTPYTGDGSFLEGPTENTTALWDQVMELNKEEREHGGLCLIWTRRFLRPSYPMLPAISIRTRRPS